MLIRHDPFTPLERAFDVFPPGPPWLRRFRSAAPLDVWREGGEVTVAVDLPGVRAEDIEVTVERNVLTIRAERHAPVHGAREQLIAERAYGSVTRTLDLGENLDTQRLGARYADGVLKVTVPVAEGSTPRTVSVETGEVPERASKVIEPEGETAA